MWDLVNSFPFSPFLHTNSSLCVFSILHFLLFLLISYNNINFSIKNGQENKRRAIICIYKFIKTKYNGQIFNLADVEEILEIPLTESVQEDSWIQNHSSDGMCYAKGCWGVYC